MTNKSLTQSLNHIFFILAILFALLVTILAQDEEPLHLDPPSQWQRTNPL